MTETFSTQFGLIVAYLLPGFVGLAGMAPLAPVVARWLRPVNQGGLNVGPTVYAILAATTVGMIVSCFRWLLIDHLHQWMGVIPTKVEIARQQTQNVMNANEKQPRAQPVTLEEKLEDLRRRLGRVEKLLIDMRGRKEPKQA